jgi:hypothetical protein
MIEYWPCFKRELLLLPYLVSGVALAVYLSSVTLPILIVYAWSFGWVKAERSEVVDKKKD